MKFEEAIRFLHSPDSTSESSDIEIPNALILLHRTWVDFDRIFPLDTERGRKRYLLWWVASGWGLYRVRHNVNSIKNRLWMEREEGRTKNGIVITGLLKSYFENQDLLPHQLRQEHFVPDIGDFCELIGPKLFPFFDLQLREFVAAIKTPIGLRKGVNVIGFINQPSGIGEDCRLSLKSLRDAGVPCDGVEFPLRPGTELKYNTNLFCLTGFQMILAILQGGSNIGKYINVGYFPWELPEWPKDYLLSLDLCDQIWSSTKFIMDAVSKHSKCKVKKIQLPVEVPAVCHKDRKRFGIPDEAVAFLYMFDFHSGFERKNVLGAISAFRKALEEEKASEAFFIIKSINAYPSHPIYQELSRIQDPRFRYFDEKLDRESLYTLINSCDIIFSPHRAEGFGRILAEGMILGKHVIATNYSGNTDFCTNATAKLLDYSLIPVKAGEYSQSEGQVWADPKMDSMISAIRDSIFDVRAGNLTENSAGKALITEEFSTAFVGKKMKETLEELWHLVD